MSLALSHYYSANTLIGRQQISAATWRSENVPVYNSDYEILRDGIEKHWSDEKHCYIYQVRSGQNKKERLSLKSLIAYYYKRN